MASSKTNRDYLPALLDSVGSSLMRESDRVKIMDIGSQFPIALTKALVFEVRLGEKIEQTDFSICIPRSESALLDQFIKEAQNNLIWEKSAVGAISLFASHWNNPETILNREIHVIWFEFDISDDPDLFLSPGFFFGLKALPNPSLDVQANLDTINTLLTPLIGEDRGVYQQSLQKCIALLPPGAHIFQIGLFFARINCPLRVCITNIPPEQITYYLKSIGYQGDLGELENMIAEIANLCKIDLAIDILEGIGTKIGLECHQKKGSPFDLIEKDARFFEYLVSKKWCTLDKQKEMRTFFGFTSFPELQANKSKAPHTTPVAKRDTMHIKLVYQPGFQIEAKGYLLAEIDQYSSIEIVKNNLLYGVLEKKMQQVLES